MNRFPPFARCALGFGQCEAPAHADHERKERDEDGKVGKLLIDREGRGAQDRQAEKTLHAGKQNESFYGGIMPYSFGRRSTGKSRHERMTQKLVPW